MKYKNAGTAMCLFLIINVSLPIGIIQDEVNSTEKERSHSFIDFAAQMEVQDFLINIIKEKNLSFRSISNTNENWAPNPSFELGCCLFPAGWIYSIDNKSKFHWDNLFSHTGTKSIGVLNVTENTRWSSWITAEFIPVDFVNKTYEFSGWYTFIGTPTEGRYAAFVLNMYDKKFNYLGCQDSLCNFSSDWKYISENTSDYKGFIVNETKFIKLGLYQYYTQNKPDSLIEVRFDDIYFGYGNNPPYPPTITGESNGAIHNFYNYTLQTNDLNCNNVKYYIDWGDNTHTITDLFESGKKIVLSHSWETKGTYIIKAKAIDEYYAESNWSILTVTMPISYNMSLIQFLKKIQERFPEIYLIVSILLKN